MIAVEGPWGQAIDLDKVADTLRLHPDIDGIAVVGNETGTGVCNPVRELAQMAHERRADFRGRGLRDGWLRYSDG